MKKVELGQFASCRLLAQMNLAGGCAEGKGWEMPLFVLQSM
jgi:hypothetical protein